MTDEDKALVERVAMLPDGNAWPSTVELLCDLRDRIEAQAAEIERLRKVIKVQASAVRTLQANEETEINILRQQSREWHQAVSSLDSEREANAILTAEIEKLCDLLREVTPPPHFGESEQSKANHGGSRPAQPWGKRND